MDPDKPPYPEPSRIKKWLVIGLLCFPTIFALVQIARGIFFGVIYSGGRGGRDMVFQWGDPNTTIVLAWYAFMALFIPGAILVGMWATRWDRYGG
jgi:hypothetical protein